MQCMKFRVAFSVSNVNRRSFLNGIRRNGVSSASTISVSRPRVIGLPFTSGFHGVYNDDTSYVRNRYMVVPLRDSSVCRKVQSHFCASGRQTLTLGCHIIASNASIVKSNAVVTDVQIL